MKVLAIGAHFDDVELGCGGALILHSRRGDEVTVLVLTHSAFQTPDGREVRSLGEAEAEGCKAVELIGARLECLRFPTNNLTFNEALVVGIRRVIEAFRPDVVYTHWIGDVHLDHQNAARATLSAARHVARILMYRSNGYSSAADFSGRIFVDVSRVMAEKLGLLKCFRSEYGRRGPDWDSWVLNEGRRAGSLVGVEYAEVFQPVKLLWDI